MEGSGIPDSRGIPFYSTSDLILNARSHLAVNWDARGGALELEIWRPVQVENAQSSYTLAGTVRFLGSDARRWIQSIVESQGLANVFMHIDGTQEEERRESPLAIAKDDKIRLSCDAADRNMKVEVWGKGQDGSEVRQGHLSVPLAAVVEFLGQVVAYEKQLSAVMLSQNTPPSLLEQVRK